MSEEEVINRFVGDYVANGQFQSPRPAKDPWFPPKGLKLNLIKVDLGDGQLGAKVRLEPPPNSHFQGKDAIEAATYRVKDGNLFAEKLAFRPDLTVDETLEMDGQIMLHKVRFSDGEEGDWTCPPSDPE